MSSKPSESRKTKSERAAASRERLAQLESKHRATRRKQIGLGFGITVIVVVVALIVARVAIGKNTGTAVARTNGGTVAAQIAGVQAGVIDTVGAGTGVTPPIKLPPRQAALTSGGKPQIVYVGAEYCPYCAAERWAVTQAMSRFGTFTDLGQTSSDPNDVYPSTATLSFHGATYASTYLAFQGIEQTDNKHQALDSTPANVQALLTKYDAAPYVSSQASGSIPFVDLGGKSLISGASFTPQMLAGLTQKQIAADLSNPGSPVAKAVIGSANSITKSLCALTKNQPTNVCTAAGVTAAA